MPTLARFTSHTKFLLLSSLLFAFSIPTWAGGINAVAISKAGEAMPDVVFYATPIGTPAPPAGKIEPMIVAQDHMQFTPYVTIARVGTEIKFPNYDKVEHHVKSFSPAKEFEIKPYQKTTPAPILFDKPGIVVAYCLLHEWMRTSVVIVDTPYFAKSDEKGSAALENLPAGSYELHAWHPDMGYVKAPLTQLISVNAQGATPIKFTFDFVPKKRKMPKMDQVSF